MSDIQATTGQAAIDHLVRLLQMNPVHQGTEIIAARREALGLAKEANATRSPPAEEVRALRRKVLDQLESLRSQFWTMPIDELYHQLDALNHQGFVDLEASIGRLRVVAVHRDQFPALSEKPDFDGAFFSMLKDVLIRSPRDTAVIREQILSTFRGRARRKRGRRMVALLKTEMPAIYELEADWFDALYRQKIQPRVTYVTSNHARTGTGAGSKFGAGSYWWVIWVAVGVSSSLFRLANDRDNTYHSRSPSIPSVPSYQFKPTPSFIPREGVNPKVEESKRRPFFESDKEVWQPYSTPSSPSPETRKSPKSFGNQEPFVLPQAPDPIEPLKKSDDRYSR